MQKNKFLEFQMQGVSRFGAFFRNKNTCMTMERGMMRESQQARWTSPKSKTMDKLPSPIMG